jgi:hypothetical protein
MYLAHEKSRNKKRKSNVYICVFKMKYHIALQTCILKGIFSLQYLVFDLKFLYYQKITNFIHPLSKISNKKKFNEYK